MPEHLDGVVRISYEITRGSTGTVENFVLQASEAAVKVTLSSDVLSIENDDLAISPCEDLEIAKGVAAVFVVGWCGLLQQSECKIPKVQILASTACDLEAKVTLWARLQSRRPRDVWESKPVCTVKGVGSVAEAEKQALAAFQNLLAASIAECETQAREALPSVVPTSKTTRSSPLAGAGKNHA
jgi:hypothetical protein